jgi:methylmalonyl-CoA mutase
VLDIDNDAVRRRRWSRLEKLKRERDGSEVREALAKLEKCAAAGEGNLLECAVEAARKRATLGEISLALGKCLGAIRSHNAHHRRRVFGGQCGR